MGQGVTLVMPTFERAHTIGRAIASLLRQTYPDWELVVVDGASTDATAQVVSSFSDGRIRYIAQETNEGVTAARSRGLDEARGEWIGMLDSDDELVPHALETLLGVRDTWGPRLDAVSCNCIDSRSGRLTGKGLDRDRFLTVPLVIERARGEHWGIMHRRIVGSHRFNPAIRGFEGHLWYRIHEGAVWYYVHRGLRVYHREGTDRNSLRANIDYDLYRQIFDHDPELLRLLARWSRKGLARFARHAAGAFLLARDRQHLRAAVELLRRRVVRSAIDDHEALAEGAASSAVLRDAPARPARAIAPAR